MHSLPSHCAGRTILHLGSGRKYDAGAVNVDLVPTTGPDIVHDLNVRPWPLPNDCFREVRAFDVIEHLTDIIGVMEEIHRVCRDGAVVKITVPHYSCRNAFTDITHRHYFSVSSFDYFTGDNELGFYTNRRFSKRKAEIVFYPSLVNKAIWRLARRFPVGYERRYAWMFPAWFLSFELVVDKSAAAG